jgi:hypothetical protein
MRHSFKRPCPFSNSVRSEFFSGVCAFLFLFAASDSDTLLSLVQEQPILRRVEYSGNGGECMHKMGAWNVRGKKEAEKESKMQ